VIGALELGIYCACVDFMLQLAALLGISYRDANALLFFVVWPVITLVLLAIVLVQRRALRATRKPPPRRA
jgi:hypothetical protein